MPSDNEIILAAAGSGKTTTIVESAISDRNKRAALVTFTNNAEQEFRSKCYEIAGHVPAHVRPITWFSFLLQHFVRPYQSALLPGRIKGLAFVQGHSTQGIKASNRRVFNTDKRYRIYSDKIARFACEIIAATNGAPLRRAEEIFDHIYIDELQDLAGFDLDLLEYLLASDLDVTLVGDHRQATYRTHQSRRNQKFGGTHIVDKLKEWDGQNTAQIVIHNHSWRCVQSICDFADLFFPNAPKTTSKNQTVTAHDGVFLVHERNLETYKERYRPQALRFDRRTKVSETPIYNFGEAKGMTFQRVLIYPHGKLKAYLKTGDLKDAGLSLAKLYVGVTRARQSVAICVPDSFKPSPIHGVNVYDP